MSFDEYVNHISQKYRLAVAISVIKTKPNDLSIEDFLKQLQRKINIEPDPNETVCSEDFNFDDDTVEKQQFVSEQVNNRNNIDFKSNEKLIHQVNEDSLISQTILGDFVIEDVDRQESDIQKETSVIGDTLNLLKATGGMENQASSQLTLSESQAGAMVNNPDTTCCYSTDNGYTTAAPETNIDSQATKLYTLYGFKEDYTHVSETQVEQFIVSEKFIRNVNLQDTVNDNEIVVTTNMEYIDPNKTVPVYNKNINEVLNKNKNTPNVTHNTFENVEDEDLYENIEECDEMLVEEQTDKDNDIQTVKVPFKVLEEMNKVKSYLSKKDRRNTEGYATDSGYRSHSQLRYSFKTLSQNTQPGVWLDQSAQCLLTYMVQAPTTSDDITKEISQVLGQLIDRLHEEENYPTFLEELLQTVDNLIKDIHEGGSWDEYMVLTKDENVYHLNLLNKSKHILRHSIDNMTDILEKLHIKLTQEELYELTNPWEIENISYILHALEIFLKRYMKLKEAPSQSTQNSQDDGVITKRSSITDMWRKKWNPNYRETTKVHENLTICAVKRCSAVLNKIIVECMEGYSLIAYAALQCFNMIQS